MRQEAQTSLGVFLAAALSLVSGCAPQPGPSSAISLEPVAFSDLAAWRDDRQGEALAAFRRSCDVLLKQNRGAGKGPRSVAGRTIRWRPACQAALTVEENNNAAARAYFENWFSPFAVTGGDGKRDGLITGYYEPELRGARQRNNQFRFPLYARPVNLVTADLGKFDPSLAGRRITGRVSNGVFIPYPDRKTIEKGRFTAEPKPLVWVDSRIDAFFLHIQGSGRVQLAEGGLMRLGYAASNGRPYTAIGRTLIRRGEIARDKVSMQSIRAWLAANPDKAGDIMAQNARYIFFRELDGSAPVGAQGVELTAERSLAVDRRALPLGAPLWLETRDPLDPHKPYRRLMIAQDVGQAIKGAIRGDIFFGHGLLAARRAGLMKQKGRYFVLLPKDSSPAS